VGKSLPGGTVTREAYESLVGKTLTMLKENMPYDGLFFDIHGAMSVVGLDDPEGDLIKRIREVVGTDVLISTSMDLHGNVSKRLAQHSDLITCYRMAPHEDATESRKLHVSVLKTPSVFAIIYLGFANHMHFTVQVRHLAEQQEVVRSNAVRRQTVELKRNEKWPGMFRSKSLSSPLAVLMSKGATGSDFCILF